MKDILEKVSDDADDIFEKVSDGDKDIIEELFDDGDDIFEKFLMTYLRKCLMIAKIQAGAVLCQAQLSLKLANLTVRN